MQYSENYNMNKPDRADQYNLDHWNENTDIIDTQLKSQEDRIAQNESDIDDLDSLILTFITSDTILSGVPLNAGNVVKVLFDTDIMGNNDTTGLSITYNNVNIPIKVNKDGTLIDFKAIKISTDVYKYLQKNTTIEFIYDGTNFVINGNPIVISDANNIFYANGMSAVINLDSKIAIQYVRETVNRSTTIGIPSNIKDKIKGFTLTAYSSYSGYSAIFSTLVDYDDNLSPQLISGNGGLSASYNNSTGVITITTTSTQLNRVCGVITFAFTRS